MNTLQKRPDIATLQHILQVIPVFGIKNHGIEDFANIIKNNIEKTHQIKSTVISSMRFINGRKNIKYFYLIKTLLNLKKMREKENIILFHFDYGSYRWLDLPVWLTIEFLIIKIFFPKTSLHLFIHELFPLNPRRIREKFLLPISKLISIITFLFFDKIYCSNPIFKFRIKSTLPNLDIREHPVFSNIGEPINPDFINNKTSRQWVMFGSSGNLSRYLKSLLKNIFSIPEIIFPERLYVIGGESESSIMGLINEIKQYVPIVSYFPDLSASECSEVFMRSSYCYIDYFNDNNRNCPELLLKSGVFAAANAFALFTLTPRIDGNLFARSTGHPGILWKSNHEWDLSFHSSLNRLTIYKWYQKNSSIQGMVDMILNFN